MLLLCLWLQLGGKVNVIITVPSPKAIIIAWNIIQSSGTFLPTCASRIWFRYIFPVVDIGYVIHPTDDAFGSRIELFQSSLDYLPIASHRVIVCYTLTKKYFVFCIHTPYLRKSCKISNITHMKQMITNNYCTWLAPKMAVSWKIVCSVLFSVKYRTQINY